MLGNISSQSYVNYSQAREYLEVISCNKYDKDILEKNARIILS